LEQASQRKRLADTNRSIVISPNTELIGIKNFKLVESDMSGTTQAPRRIVITGVTRGLGRALAEGFAQAGHTVIGCGRSEAAIKELRRDLPEPHDFDTLDVIHDQGVKAWSQHVLTRFGPPDLLLNNAAVINRNARLWEVSAAEIDQIVDINIKGVINVLRHFVPAMIERGTGMIVNFSSEWGRSASPEVAPYCATKWAIEGLTRALAQELPRGLTAVPLSPGIIDTAMLRSCFGDSAGQYPNAKKWAESAVPYILNLSPKDNGKPLTIPMR
jgi:NAD(P)-dependent dehydrogenase (short-subunit alcohol dehydrogenase family)